MAGGADGYVSVEVAPELARDTTATIAATRGLHARIDEPNLLVKIPATGEGVAAIQALIAEGRSINITLIFSLTRYAQVVDAYLSGLEAFTGAGGNPSTVRSVASFFVSRVATEVDRRLERTGGREALGLRVWWLAGQGGAGIKTAPAMGQSLARAMDGEPFPAAALEFGVTPAALGVARLRVS